MLIAIIWLTLSFIKLKIQENIVNKELGGLEAKIENLQMDNSILEKFISYLKNPSFLEKEARAKFNYKDPGEEVAFVYPDTSAKAGSESLDFRWAKVPHYIKWWWYLLGY